MTTHHDGQAAAPADTDPAGTSAGDPGAQPSGDATGVICQAEAVEIGLDDDATDPFDATLLLGGIDPEGREVAVWIRLTPTTITNLTERLGEVLFAQQDILGISGRGTTTGGVVPDRDATVDDEDEDDSKTGEGRVRRFFDPMGIRHLKDRSPRTTVYLGAAIASLVILSFILQLLRG